MLTTLVIIAVLLNLAVVAVAIVLLRRISAPDPVQLSAAVQSVNDALSMKFVSATADMASRLEQTKGDLRQQITDRLAAGFADIRASVEQQLTNGRNEQAGRLSEFGQQLETKLDQLSARQAESLAASRQELAGSLAITSAQLRAALDSFNQSTTQSLDAIRAQVDEKLLAISAGVQQKLDDNIREGFAHFTKVQEHLQAAEEQLRQVGALGVSINDLNNLLKLPHLRGTDFGEASLSRLLGDFLPTNMYEEQAAVHGGARVDAMINFPDRRLPIDSKFPREQVLPLFESSEPAALAAAREQLVRVLKTEGKRIAQYIQPEHGTMDIALMYLPSETLYFETVTNADAVEALTNLKVFPVSPNTLMMMLHTVALAYKWYEVASRFEETRKELGKAQTSLGHFQRKFEELGKSLDKAQGAFETAARHLKHYRTRVTAISGEEIPALEDDHDAGFQVAKVTMKLGGDTEP